MHIYEVVQTSPKYIWRLFHSLNENLLPKPSLTILPFPSLWQPLIIFLSVFLYLFWMFLISGILPLWPFRGCLHISRGDSFISFLFLSVLAFLLFEREIPDELKIKERSPSMWDASNPRVETTVMVWRQSHKPDQKRLTLPMPKQKQEKCRKLRWKTTNWKACLTTQGQRKFNIPAMQKTLKSQCF